MIVEAPRVAPQTRRQDSASRRRVSSVLGAVLVVLGISVLFSSLGALASPPAAVYPPAAPRHISHVDDIAAMPTPPSERLRYANTPVAGPLPSAARTDAVERQPFTLPHDSPVTDQPLRRRGEALDEGNSFSAGAVTTVDAPRSTVASPPMPEMPPPLHIAIPNVGIDTAVVEVSATPVVVDGRTVFTWQVADWAAGHHSTSANPGEDGNIVIAGHADVRGEVFRNLPRVVVGDEVTLTSAAGTFRYVVEEIHLREYTEASLDEQIAAGEFLGPMEGERLTLVTCWPYQVDTHRLIVVAKPR